MIYLLLQPPPPPPPPPRQSPELGAGIAGRPNRESKSKLNSCSSLSAGRKRPGWRPERHELFSGRMAAGSRGPSACQRADFLIKCVYLAWRRRHCCCCRRRCLCGRQTSGRRDERRPQETSAQMPPVDCPSAAHQSKRRPPAPIEMDGFRIGSACGFGPTLAGAGSICHRHPRAIDQARALGGKGRAPAVRRPNGSGRPCQRARSLARASNGAHSGQSWLARPRVGQSRF